MRQTPYLSLRVLPEWKDVAIYFLFLRGKSGQASSEDLLPLGYGGRDRIEVRVKLKIIPLTLTLSLQGRENRAELPSPLTGEG
jgi:hypothetical protein